MSIPGYDAWKTMTPEEDRESRAGGLCPWCGAYSKRSCEMEEDMGVCPWEQSDPDPDEMRELAKEPSDDRS